MFEYLAITKSLPSCKKEPRSSPRSTMSHRTEETHTVHKEQNGGCMHGCPYLRGELELDVVAGESGGILGALLHLPWEDKLVLEHMVQQNVLEVSR